MTPSAATLLVFITCPANAADALATALVEARLAACINILPSVRSVYRWQNAVETAEECLLIAKTSAAGYAALEASVVQRHPYELPEIVAVDITRGLPAYLQWLTDSLQ
jgi:periplasmic divalent cation tolerance protein